MVAAVVMQATALEWRRTARERRDRTEWEWCGPGRRPRPAGHSWRTWESDPGVREGRTHVPRHPVKDCEPSLRHNQRQPKWLAYEDLRNQSTNVEGLRSV
jgi:hypothetical protein